MLALKRGDKGPEVVKLQNALIAAGFGVGATGADADFGPATERAVRDFQNVQGIPDTGIADDTTLKALGLGGGPSMGLLLGIGALLVGAVVLSRGGLSGPPKRQKRRKKKRK